MKTLSFVLALAMVLAAPTLAGPHPGHLPGVGTFAYNGTVTPAVRHMAALELW